MATFYMKQKVFSIRDRLTIIDPLEQERYYVEGKIISLGKQLTMHDSASGTAVAFIKQRLMRIRTTFDIEVDGTTIATVERKILSFKPKYILKGTDWRVDGDLWGHEYDLVGPDGVPHAHISKAWVSWGDSYKIDIDGVPEVQMLALVVALDAAMAINTNNAMAASAST
jgi:uncharacterized protein YxjI